MVKEVEVAGIRWVGGDNKSAMSLIKLVSLLPLGKSFSSFF